MMPDVRPVALYHRHVPPVRLLVVGDHDTRIETHRGIDHTLTLLPADVDARWQRTDEPFSAAGADALWFAPGTPYRDDEAVHTAIEHARSAGIPMYGTCGGLQYMAVEFARHVAGIGNAAHAETDPDAEQAVVAPLSCSLVGQRRTIHPVPGTRLAEIVGEEPFSGFHYCNYGISAAFRDRLEAAGLVVSATARDAGIEGIELPNHPFAMATLFQPQMESLETGTLHPLLEALVGAGRAAARTVSPT
jgi:CTP synthase (UTP-ammonia lyase)